jgi:protein gp37
MGDKTGISWTDATWNPLRGCSRVSEGCRNCYAEMIAARFCQPGQAYHGLANPRTGKWTGEVALVESALDQPVRWKKPRRIFVNSMSDLFHEKVADEWIDRIFSVMAAAKQHTFQVLTKRPERMLAWFNEPGQDAEHCADMMDAPWPLPNVWLGVSVEDQKTADERIPLLLQTPAAVRWVSYEPALGPVDFSGNWLRCGKPAVHAHCNPHLNWIVVGGESGGKARLFDPRWAMAVRDQCRKAGVAFYMKQLGDHPVYPYPESGSMLIPWKPKKRGGSDPAEWHESLRVQEFPA